VKATTVENRLSHYLITGAFAGAVLTGAVGLSRPAQAQDMSSILGAVISQVVTLLNNNNNNNNNNNYNNGYYNNGNYNNNWQYSHSQANTVVGRTNYGGTVYGDGRIVYNGQTYYSSNDGRTPCSYIVSNAPRCTSSARGYRIAQNAPHPQWDNAQHNWHNGNENGQGNNGHHYGEDQNHGNNGNNGNNDHNNHN
jgi:hypothetical protein